MNNRFKHPKILTRLLLGLVSVFLLSGIFLSAWPTWEKHQAEAKKVAVAQVTVPPKVFPAVSLEAKAAVVVNAKNGKVIFGKNETEKMPLASITKLMTAYVASQSLGPADQVTISPQALAGGSNAGLLVGDAWTVKNLTDYMLTTSSNGAASALAEAVNSRGLDFISKMNDTAANLGLSSTRYMNETGLDLGQNFGGSYGSATDVATLVRHILKTKPDLMRPTVKPSIYTSSASGLVYTGENTNDIVGKIPGLIGSKTGYTDSAGGNLTVVFDAGLAQPVVIVVLGSSKDGRFSDVLALTRATVDYYSE